jgi:hypothetical protein
MNNIKQEMIKVKGEKQFIPMGKMVGIANLPR